MNSILITGNPGIGKTTLIKKIIQALNKNADGFYTEEIREEGKRIGFKIVTIAGKEGILASIHINSRYKVGKYKVNLQDLENIALPSIENALDNSKAIIIDEIGTMELYSEKFRGIILNALDSTCRLIATIKLKDTGFISKIKSRKDVVLFNIDYSNRNKAFNEIIKMIKE